MVETELFINKSCFYIRIDAYLNIMPDLFRIHFSPYQFRVVECRAVDFRLSNVLLVHNNRVKVAVIWCSFLLPLTDHKCDHRPASVRKETTNIEPQSVVLLYVLYQLVIDDTIPIFEFEYWDIIYLDSLLVTNSIKYVETFRNGLEIDPANKQISRYDDINDVYDENMRIFSFWN